MSRFQDNFLNKINEFGPNCSFLYFCAPFYFLAFLSAFSGPIPPLIPDVSGHPFQSNPATVPGIPTTPLLGA
jgi:hypothetical protein